MLTVFYSMLLRKDIDIKKSIVKGFLILLVTFFSYMNVANADSSSAIVAKKAELAQKSSALSDSKEQHMDNIDAKIKELQAKKKSLSGNEKAVEKIDAKLKKLEAKKSALAGRTKKAEGKINHKMNDLKNKENTLK